MHFCIYIFGIIYYYFCRARKILIKKIKNLFPLLYDLRRTIKNNTKYCTEDLSLRIDII